MCGAQISGTLSWAELYETMRGFLDGAAKLDSSAPPADLGYNIRPTQQVHMAAIENDQLLLTTARWWFIPPWHKGSVKDWKQTTFNAKIETAAEKPSFRQAWRHQRCIIPALGYYEWTGEKGHKQPWHIAPQTNAPLFFFAGLHSQLDTGLRTCTILTRPALPQIAHLHSRMPVMLDSNQIMPWLRHEQTDTETHDTLGTSWDDRMTFNTVRPFKSTDDGAELIEPFDPPQQLGLAL